MAEDAVRQFASVGDTADESAQPPAALPPAAAPQQTAERKPKPNLYERRRAAIQRRFGFAYFALAVATGIAIGLVVVLVGRSSGKHEAWSPFKPTSNGLEGAQQIAGYVSRRYRLGNELLAGAFASAPVVQGGTPIGAAAVRTGFTKERVQDVRFYRTDHAVMYQFLGTKDDGTIPGTASVARGNLLRQEILEMSLYSMKYLGGIDTVIAFPPPTIGSDGKPAVTRAILLRKPDLKAQLSRPLGDTIPPGKTETLGRQTTAEERAAVAKVQFMQYSGQQLPSGDFLLVLTPVA